MQKNKKYVEICFMRHGQTDWNIKSILQGQTETELNETGRKQAKEKKKILGQFKPDLIISSPQKRTMQTVELMTEGKYSVVTDDRLKERYYADVEGMSFEEIKKKYPSFELFQVNGLPYLIDVPKGGETYVDVFKRVKKFLIETIVGNQGKKIVVMSHGDPLDMVDAILAGKTWREGVGGWCKNTRVQRVRAGINNRGEIEKI